jgi:hypothetical protein
MRKLLLTAVLGVLLLPAVASAQGTIAGTVRDTTGAVLPGVTVQVSSPALIGGNREAVTDSSGVYSIIDLRPGTYRVQFSLPGFSTMVREGILIEGTFAAQVNADLQLGSLEETLTVTGESPVVDVRSATPVKVLNREQMSELPAIRVLDRQASMMPGIQVRIPVDSTGSGQGQVSMYGSQAGDSRWMVDGLPITFGSGGGGSQQALNDSGFEQVSFDDGMGSAEMTTGGVRINAILKEGGDRFTGQFWANYAPGWQSENLTPELKAAGVGGTGKIEYDYDFGPSFGGPIKRQKLWFFGAYRKKGVQQTVFNTFTREGEPWVSRSGWYQTGTGRLTYQASKRDKISFSYEGNGARPGAGSPGSASGAGPNQPPEASQTLWVIYAYQTQLKWTSTPTNRLLFETAFGKSYTDGNNGFIYREDVLPFAVSRLDSGTGKRADAPQATGTHGWTHLYSTRASTSYVTGSHAVKVGLNLIAGHIDTLRDLGRGNVTQVTLINGVPNSVTVDNSPFRAFANQDADLGLYAQDTMTLRRLTISGGLRWTWLKQSIPAQSAVAGNFVPAREFAAVDNVPNWKNWMPRIGGSYDVFGDGKTAIKVSAGKYMSAESLGFANQFNPLAASTDVRTWTDRDGNGSVFDTGTFNVQTNEIGPPRVTNFGSARATARLDPDASRAYNWSYSAALQHELFPGVSVNASYYHRRFYNCTSATGGTPACSSGRVQNLAVDPVADYTPFTYIGPRDERLPDGGGAVITLYNLNPNKAGLSNLIVTDSDNGSEYNGFELSMNARLRSGMIFGGITVGQTHTNNCDVENPNDLQFCENTTPWQPEYKLAWSYPLPYDFQVSGTIRTYPGASIQANQTANSAVLGTQLTGGVANILVLLMDPTDEYLEHVKAFDLRIAKSFRFGVSRFQVFSDIINVPNLATIGGVTNNYGPNWLSPLGAPGGRFVRIGTQFDF